jgi:hypothetical protein
LSTRCLAVLWARADPREGGRDVTIEASRARGPSRRRDKTGDARAAATQASQRRAERGKITPTAYRRRRIVGWSLVGLGVAIGVQHLFSHMGFFQVISAGMDDLVVGYPIAAALGIADSVVLSKA